MEEQKKTYQLPPSGTFSNHLDTFIRHRGLQKAQLAKELGVSSTTLSSYITGRRAVPDDRRIQFAQLLKSSVEELFPLSVPPVSTTHARNPSQTPIQPLFSCSQGEPCFPQHTHESARMNAEDAIHAVESDRVMQRRQMLSHMLNVLGMAALFSPGSSHSTEPIQQFQSPTSLRFYEHLLALSWNSYYNGTTHDIRSIIDATLPMLIEDATHAHQEEDQQSLLLLLCRFYQLSGVLARDRMQLSQALSDGKKAIELAFHVEDAECIVASLFRRAKTYQKQHRQVEALQDLEAALAYAARARLPLKGYVHQAAAEMYALLAPHEPSMQKKSLSLFDQVEQMLLQGPIVDDGSFVKLSMTGLAIDRVQALTRFHHLQEARQALALAQTQTQGYIPRWQARFLLAKAEIFLAEHDVEGCCTVLDEAFQHIQTIQSRSQGRRLQELYQRLAVSYPHQRHVKQLGEQLSLAVSSSHTPQD